MAQATIFKSHLVGMKMDTLPVEALEGLLCYVPACGNHSEGNANYELALPTATSSSYVVVVANDNWKSEVTLKSRRQP